MKKLLSVLLSMIVILGCIAPMASASDQGATIPSEHPIIYISGDSIPIAYHDEKGNVKEFCIDTTLDMFKSDDDSNSNILESAANILLPFILEGIASGKWDNYYKAVYNEISDAMGPVQLDNDGNAKEGTGITEEQKQYMEHVQTFDNRWKGGYHEKDSYRFYYDWRLDPEINADALYNYIQGVKKATGFSKIGISARCLGCNVLMCYIDKYGTDDLQGVGIDVATSMGAEFISGLISGQFGIDGNSISRFITDMTYFWGRESDLTEFASTLIDLLDNTGALDGLSKAGLDKIYNQIEYGIISALSLSLMMTYPGYWALVTEADFPSAMRYVFGKENDPKRTEYAGLIEKITHYNDNFKPRIKEIYSKLSKDGVNTCIISKYGIQMTPTLAKGDIIGDQYCSAYSSSLGATTSTIYTTLSDEYIENAEKNGTAKYISPDKQIDASTCLFPDNTWFLKGVFHGYYSNHESDLIVKVINADHQITVGELEEYPQYMVYFANEKRFEPMTEENCHNEFWAADEKIDNPQTKFEKLFSFIQSLLKWLKVAFKLISANLGADAA